MRPSRCASRGSSISGVSVQNQPHPKQESASAKLRCIRRQPILQASTIVCASRERKKPTWRKNLITVMTLMTVMPSIIQKADVQNVCQETKEEGFSRKSPLFTCHYPSSLLVSNAVTSL